MTKKAKILFLADTHLGFDMPLKPRFERRRRGYDFFNNYELALQPALKKEVDLVIHGGDMFFRSRVHPNIVSQAFQPLHKIAQNNLPIFIVPGNHERSWIPTSLFDTHPLIHIYEKPKTYFVTINGIKLALAGFPFIRNGIRWQFKNTIEKTNFVIQDADVRLLCFHQIVEGAQVGIQNYTFKTGEEVIQAKDIPHSFHAILAGHIHRCQVLRAGLDGKRFPAPILYAGAIERTSFAERKEKKGYFVIEIEQSKLKGEFKINWNFVELPTRPMVVITVEDKIIKKRLARDYLKNKISRLDENSMVKISFDSNEPNDWCLINADFLRSIAPLTMNIELSFPKQARPSLRSP